MKLFSRLFKKREPEKFDTYAYMGSLGVSPNHMNMYQDAVKKIEEFKKQYR